MELTDRARADLEAYLARVEDLAARDPDVDAAAVAEGLREHVTAALEARDAGDPATASELAEVLERLGDPVEWIGEGGGSPPSPEGPDDPWRATLHRGARRALRIGEHAIVLVALLWPLALAWSAAQPGGFLYAWVEGGTRWTEFRPPLYWARIAAIAAGMLGAWWLMTGIFLLTPPGSSLRSRLRSLWDLGPVAVLVIAGLVSLFISSLGGLL